MKPPHFSPRRFVFSLVFASAMSQRSSSYSMDFLSRKGELQLNGQRFHLKGTNWFGFETETKVVHGIWSFSLESFLDFLVRHKFNAIRIPFGADLAFELDTFVPKAVNATTNPHLASRPSGFILDHLIHESARRGILIMLDMHCLTATAGITDLWYMDGFPEKRLLQAWEIMVQRYARSWNVFAYDIKNEPHDSATWGDSNQSTDWRLAAERIGNSLLAINPNALIFVEGTSGKQHPKTTPEAAFWGGSLASARESPVQLHIPDKLVYSPHVYGPGVYMQEYFNNSNFPANMPSIWTRQWGHLLQEPKAGPAVVTGEWGGFFRSGDLEQTWAEAFVEYLTKLGATDQFFWCLNPNSGDTGGLLEDDWKTAASYKLDLIHRLCPSPSKILVDGQGRPTDVVHGGCGESWPAQRLEEDHEVCQMQDPHASSAGHQAGLPEQQETNACNNGQEDLAGMPSLLDIEVDTTDMPGVSATAKVVKTWVEDAGARFQIEAMVINMSQDDVPDLQAQFSQGAGVVQVWCMTPITEGSLYRLPEWSTQHGGLKPNQPLRWGGIVSDPNTRITYRPSQSHAGHTEL